MNEHNVPTVTPTSSDAETQAGLAPMYHLILMDDDDHTYMYVVEMLGDVFGYGREKAFALASIVDHEGTVIVETAGHEQVLRHQERIHGFGADPRVPRCAGSMSAVIEPVP